MQSEPIMDLAHLAHLELLTPKPEESLRFFVDVMGMTESGREGDSVYLRAYDDYERHTLKLTASKLPGMGHVAYRARSPQALERRVAALKGSGFDIGWTKGDLAHGPAFLCQDPDGHKIELYYETQWYQAAARAEAGAEESGAALSRARHERSPPRSLERPRGRHQSQPRILRELPRLPADGADCPQQRQGSGDVDDRAPTRATTSPTRADHTGTKGRFHHVTYAVNSREEVLIAADISLENGVPIETGPHKHAIQQTFFLYVYEPGGNRVEVANAGARLILAPDWKPIRWSEAERKKGQAWGLKTIESFHTYGTPPVETVTK